MALRQTLKGALMTLRMVLNQVVVTFASALMLIYVGLSVIAVGLFFWR
jgi:hypothetical protein